MSNKFLILKTVYFTGNTDDNAPIAVPDNIKDVIKSLEDVVENLITWFSNYQQK